MLFWASDGKMVKYFVCLLFLIDAIDFYWWQTRQFGSDKGIEGFGKGRGTSSSCQLQEESSGSRAKWIEWQTEEAALTIPDETANIPDTENK